jgi:hypothetical protein
MANIVYNPSASRTAPQQLNIVLGNAFHNPIPCACNVGLNSMRFPMSSKCGRIVIVW